MCFLPLLGCRRAWQKEELLASTRKTGSREQSGAASASLRESVLFLIFFFCLLCGGATTAADSLQVCLIQLDTKVCSSDGEEMHGRPNVACWN